MYQMFHKAIEDFSGVFHYLEAERRGMGRGRSAVGPMKRWRAADHVPLPKNNKGFGSFQAIDPAPGRVSLVVSELRDGGDLGLDLT